MTEFKMPVGEYQWLENEEFELIKNSFMDIPFDGDYGYIFVVDIDYPEHLHDLHNDLPFCVENMNVGKTRKLVPNLYDKKNYCCHYLTLQQAIRNNLILRKIHKIIKFKQSYWLRSYIDLCVKLRQIFSDSEFLKQLYKNLANCIFGKMIQSTLKYRIVKLITKWLTRGHVLNANRLLKDPRFKSFSILNENLVAIEMQKNSVKYDKPTIVGFSILECSKYHMYDFIYGVLKRYIAPSSVKISYIDTDGIIVTITEVDPYEFIKQHPEKFDTSDYQVDNPYNIILQNKKVPGLFHDEGKGYPVTRFVALKAKAYVIEFQFGVQKKVIKKLKSISKSVTKTFEFTDYYKVWRDKTVVYAKMFAINNTNHVMETVSINKKSLSHNDDKRFVVDDNIRTLALGHKDIVNQMTC